MKSIMLYFGSFNPIHKGHVAIAEYVLGEGLCDELWFVVSPQNPLKDIGVLIDEKDRLAMVGLAVSSSDYGDRMKAVDVEFSLPKPSYTIDTLRVLSGMHPELTFSILVGSDVAGQFEKWKEWETILSDYPVYMYPRLGYVYEDSGKGFIFLAEAPYFDFSSTEIRNLIGSGVDVSSMLPCAVYDYIKKKGLWM